MSSSFRAAVERQNQHRMELARILEKQSEKEKRTDQAKRNLAFALLATGGIIAYKKGLFDESLSAEPKKLFAEMKSAVNEQGLTSLFQEELQKKDPLLLGVQPQGLSHWSTRYEPGALARQDVFFIPYGSRGKISGVYAPASLEQIRRVAEFVKRPPLQQPREGKYRPANSADLLKVPPLRDPQAARSDRYEHVGRSIPFRLVPDEREFPDLKQVETRKTNSDR